MLKESAKSNAPQRRNRPPLTRIRRHLSRIPAPRSLPKRHVHGIPTDEEEGFTSVELVVLVPVLMLVVLLVVEAAVVRHGNQVAKAAAEDGAAAARAYGGSVA